MNFRAKYLLALTAAVGIGSLSAQPGLDPLTGGAPPPTPTRELTVAQMTARNEELGKRAHVDYRHVLHLQAIAKKQKDVIKLTCINDKLVQLKPIANLMDKDRAELDGHLAANSDERFASFDRVVASAQTIHGLREEASVCAGEPEIAGASEALVSEPAFPIDPTLGDPFEPTIEDPGYASPYN